MLPPSHLFPTFSVDESGVARVCFTMRCVYLGAIHLVLSQSLNLGRPSPPPLPHLNGFCCVFRRLRMSALLFLAVIKLQTTMRLTR